MIKRVAILLLFLPFFSCDEESEIDLGSDNEVEVEWQEAANSTMNEFLDTYWNAQGQYFNYNNVGNKDFHYWPQAHGLDVLLDAYQRSSDCVLLDYINQWFEGVRENNGNTFLNSFYDDMEWNALAMLRAEEITGDEKFKAAAITVWDDIKTGWNDNAGGGIMWVKGKPYGKNACSNAPAAILAARLYQSNQEQKYLDWALEIYNWQKSTLVEPSTGAVWDNVVEENGNLNFQKDWIFTYNQGTYLGAALELYNITGESIYLNDAIKSADYTLNALVDANDRLLKSEGAGDGGLFKGVFIRYFTQLILHPDLPDGVRNRYVIFLEHNANTLWSEGTEKNSYLFGTYWKNKPQGTVDLTVQLSGIMLIEAAAQLEREELID
jgi:predicted alpha-1,6-mannanase (GH76 family)